MKLAGKTLATLVAVTSIAHASAAKIEPGMYAVDPMHTKVGFEVPHLVISSVEGRFGKFKGDIVFAEKFENSKVSVVIETASIDTGVGQRDEHLRSADFFDAVQFPEMTFVSKRIVGMPSSFKIIGDLKIRGVTKEVTLDAKVLGGVVDAYGNTKAAFKATTAFNRKDFGLTWSKLVEAGPVVGDEVTITLNIQGAKVPPQTAQN